MGGTRGGRQNSESLTAILAAAAFISWAGAMLPATAVFAGEATPIVSDARVIGDNQRVRFIADLSAKVDLTVFTLADPYRIVVDLPEVHFALPTDAGSGGRGMISAFRYGLFAAGRSRIVIDLAAPVAIDKTFVTDPTADQPARLVVDAVPTTRDLFLANARAYRQDKGVAAAERADRTLAAPVAPSAGRRVVVLDPGHGGIDSGAHGRGGALEKTVTLAFAKALAAALGDRGRYEVYLTRDDDSFVTLGERVALARAHNADLFLSIHANSFPGAAVRGATVYTVSDEASDKMAAEMAASENQSDILAGIDVDGEDSDQVKDILLDLTRRETRNFGVVFARHLVDELGKSTEMFKIPHQQASFKVLEAPDVPSALVELGYLSNSGDERLLQSAGWRSEAAQAVAAAVDEFFGQAVAGQAGQ
jgi:N-acetylmuramoyl-L-alanine amidase